MSMAIIVLFFGGIIGLLIFGGLIFLQAYLSKQESGILGFILPGISLILSLMMTFVISSLLPVTNTVVMQDANPPSVTYGIGGIILTFLILNIPTLVYLVVYFVIRAGKKQQTRMS